MNPEDKKTLEPIDPKQPAAYDIQGRPLYYAPPSQSSLPTGSVSSGPNSSSSDGRSTAPDVIQRAEESRRRYSQLNLSEGEYVIAEVVRHPFGLFQIWLIAFALIGAFGALVYGYASTQSNAVAAFNNAVPIALVALVLLSIIVVIGAVVASYVYNNNKFYLTNESVIQEIQVSLFARREQTVSLGRIEDASYRQDGFIPTTFNYGKIRLSTVGDESTYQFNYVTNPKKVIGELNDEIERFKGIHH